MGFVKIALATLFGATLFVGLNPAKAVSPEKFIKFDIPVLPEFARHADLLMYPPYLALALENNGINPSLTSRVTIADRASFQIKSGVVRFKQRNGEIYFYEAGLGLSPAGIDTKLLLPVEVDARRVTQGTLTIKVFLPLADLVSGDLQERIAFKISALAGIQSQRKVLAYLDGLMEQPPKDRSIDGVLEKILIESYHRAVTAPSVASAQVDRGAAEPLSDQWLFLFTVCIWFIGLPAFLLYVRRRRLLSVSK